MWDAIWDKPRGRARGRAKEDFLVEDYNYSLKTIYDQFTTFN